MTRVLSKPLIRLIGYPGMSYFEVVASAMFFQFSLYISVRLAHRGFTFGELGLVAFGATVLFMELVNLTIAKVCPHLAIITPIEPGCSSVP